MDISTCKIVHPCLDVIVVKYVQDIPKSVCNINQERKDLQRRTIYITDLYHEHILDCILL